MEFLSRNKNQILLFVLEALVGILLLLDPMSFTSGIIIAAGVILLIAGIASVISYFRTEALLAAQTRKLATGLVLLLFGIFCITHTDWFIATFPLLTILYGVATLLAGLNKLQWAVDSFRLHMGRWYMPAISAALSIVCAAILLANPFGTTKVLWMFAGISLIAEAICDLIVMIFTSRRPEEETADAE